MSGFPLNSEQRPPVEEHDRSLILSAGAGSGKTRVLVERYLKILEDAGWDPALPARILAITFTEKAAQEMRERILQSLEARAAEAEGAAGARLITLAREMESAPISTIHGFCSRLLRENATEAGLDPRFTIPGELDLHDLKRGVLADLFAEGDGDLELTVGELGADAVGNALDEIRDLRRSLGLPCDRLRGDAADRTAAGHDAWAAAVLTAGHLAWRDGLMARFDDLCAHLPGGAHPSDKMQGKIDLARARLSAALPGELAPGLPAGLKSDMSRFSGKGKAIDDGGRLVASWTRLKGEIEREMVLMDVLADPRGESAGRPAGLNGAFLRLLARYDERIAAEMANRSWLDFEDLQLAAVALLRGDPGVAARCRDLYRHVLVDEFQDTNHLQLELVRLLVPPEGRGALFLVGDERQSIYAFRNADVEVFRGERRRLAREGAAASLASNYRSHPALMAFFNALFPHDDFPPLAARRELEADPPDADPRVLLQVTPQNLGGSDPEADTLPAARRRAAETLADTLRRLHDEGLQVGDGRPVDWGDIAILLRSGTDIGLLARALAERGIPHEAAGGRDYYLRQELRDLEDLLAALEDPWHRLKLARGLRGDIIGISTADLLAVLPRAPRGHDGRDGGEALAFWESIDRGAGDAPGLSEDGLRRLRRFLALRRRFAGRLFRLPLRTLILELIEASDFDLLAATGPRPLKVLRNLRQLADLVTELESGGRLGVREFLDLMDRTREVAPKREEAWVPEEGESLVRILTIHSAKGLEFPVLVVADLDRETGRLDAPTDIAGLRWTDEATGRVDAPVGIRWRDLSDDPHPDPVHYLLGRARRERADAENLRLLYVALTRARDYLLLTGVCPRRDAAGAREAFALPPDNPGASFLDRIRGRLLDGDAARFCRVEFAEGESAWRPGRRAPRPAAPAEAAAAAPDAAEGLEATWSRLIPSPARVGRLEIPVTSLGLLQNCPLRWVLERRFRLNEAGFAGDAWVPTETAVADGPGGADFGSTLHGILERWDFHLPAAAAFERACPAALPAETRREAERLLVPLFSSGRPWPERLARGENHRREEPFTLDLGDVSLVGQTDLVFEEGGQRFLVDWKSDRVESREAIARRVEHHQYQIALYALALAEAGRPVRQAVLCFLRLELPFRQVMIDDKTLTWAARRVRRLGNLALELSRLSGGVGGGLIDRVPSPGKQPPCHGCPFKRELCSAAYRSGRRDG